jgi:hypothetical protein
MTCPVRDSRHQPRTGALHRREHGGTPTITEDTAQPRHPADTMKPTEMPVLIYRGLQYCDVCGGPLAAGETFAGICRVCRATPPPRRRASLALGRKAGGPGPSRRLT